MTLSVFKSFKINAIGILNSVNAFIIYVIVSGFQLTNLNTLKSSSKILRNVWNIVSVNGLILQALMMIYQLCKIKTVSSILIDINDIDLKVSEVVYLWNYSNRIILDEKTSKVFELQWPQESVDMVDYCFADCYILHILFDSILRHLHHRYTASRLCLRNSLHWDVHGGVCFAVFSRMPSHQIEI